MSCNTQVKDDMSSGSSTLGLSNCNWFHALRPVAYNAMAAEKHPSFQPKQISGQIAFMAHSNSTKSSLLPVR